METGFDEVIYIFLMKDTKDEILLKLKELGLDKEKRTKVLNSIEFISGIWE